jgi:hypothetical protein
MTDKPKKTREEQQNWWSDFWQLVEEDPSALIVAFFAFIDDILELNWLEGAGWAEKFANNVSETAREFLAENMLDVGPNVAEVLAKKKNNEVLETVLKEAGISTDKLWEEGPSILKGKSDAIMNALVTKHPALAKELMQAYAKDVDADKAGALGTKMHDMINKQFGMEVSPEVISGFAAVLSDEQLAGLVSKEIDFNEILTDPAVLSKILTDPKAEGLMAFVTSNIVGQITDQIGGKGNTEFEGQLTAFVDSVRQNLSATDQGKLVLGEVAKHLPAWLGGGETTGMDIANLLSKKENVDALGNADVVEAFKAINFTQHAQPTSDGARKAVASAMALQQGNNLELMTAVAKTRFSGEGNEVAGVLIDVFSRSKAGEPVNITLQRDQIKAYLTNPKNLNALTALVDKDNGLQVTVPEGLKDKDVELFFALDDVKGAVDGLKSQLGTNLTRIEIGRENNNSARIDEGVDGIINFLKRQAPEGYTLTIASADIANPVQTASLAGAFAGVDSDVLADASASLQQSLAGMNQDGGAASLGRQGERQSQTILS